MSIGRLDNKVILVTGANTGVGEHTARLYIEQGAKVRFTAAGKKL